MTLYAKWNRYAISHTKRYTISFQTGGGTAVASQSVASGSLAVVPDEPEMEGYIFDGWYSDADTLMLYDFEAPVTSSITLYAKWAEACDVTFSNQMPDDIKHLVTIPDKVYVKKSDTMAFPAITIEGNTLSNIKLSYENGAEFDPNAPISEDLTLKVTIDSYAIAGDTYYVLTEAGLNEWATATARGISYDCVLLEDITLTNKDAGNWKSIGSYGSPYDGTFDGNGHRIGSLNIKEAMSPSNWEGLGFFGYLDGTVRDLHVDGVIEITDNTGNKMSYSVGGIAGTVEDSAAIIGCSSEIKISMKAETVCAGGTAGENEGSIIDCYYIGNGTSSSFEKDGSYAHIGGITGTNDGSIIASYAIADTITATATGEAAYAASGGITGTNDGSIIASYAIVDTITATTDGFPSSVYAGGFVGDNSGTITAGYWSGGANVAVGSGSSADVQKVDGEWSSAMTAMNSAIDTWNKSNGGACPYRYTVGTSPDVPLVLENLSDGS